MKIIIIISLFFSFAIFANEDSKKRTYLNFLNSCSEGNVTYYKIPIIENALYEERYIFNGYKLDLKCLKDKIFSFHRNNTYRKQSGIPPTTSVGEHNLKSRFVRDIEFYYLGNDLEREEKKYAQITSLYNYKCSIVCSIDIDKIFFKYDKYGNEQFFYIYGNYNDLVNDGIFLEINPDILLIRHKINTGTFYYLLDTTSNSFTDINNGGIEFLENFYFVIGKENKFNSNELFWFDAKYSYNGEILELINSKGLNSYCYEINVFEHIKEIYDKMLKSKMKEFCVLK